MKEEALTVFEKGKGGVRSEGSAGHAGGLVEDGLEVVRLRLGKPGKKWNANGR